MKYWLGLAFLSTSGLLLTWAHVHRRRIQKHWSASTELLETVAPRSSLDALGRNVRPFMYAILIWIGLKTSFIFFAFNGSSVLTLFDLSGFLVLLAAYGIWFTVRTKYSNVRDLPQRHRVIEVPEAGYKIGVQHRGMGPSSDGGDDIRVRRSPGVCDPGAAVRTQIDSRGQGEEKVANERTVDRNSVTTKRAAS